LTLPGLVANGKTACARDVVEKNAGTVDFSGFKGILDRVAAVVAEYTKTHTVAAGPP
jgi:hypothetical protein